MERDAWLVFARLAKLQAFQDGNKRTALIAANAAYGSLNTENYLILPFHSFKLHEFTIYLMEFYKAQNEEEEGRAFGRMLETLPSRQERENYLHEPIEEQNFELDLSTYRVKDAFRSRKKREKSQKT